LLFSVGAMMIGSLLSEPQAEPLTQHHARKYGQQRHSKANPMAH
jgi:hypothetical protein